MKAEGPRCCAGRHGVILCLHGGNLQECVEGVVSEGATDGCFRS